MDYRNADWYLAVKDSPIGTKLRMPHEDCSQADSLMVSKSEKGVSAWCFKCATPGMFVPAPAESLQEKMARLASQEAADHTMRQTAAMPEPKDENPSDWPLEARVWLYKAGLNNHDIVQAGLYFHRAGRRVVIPVYDGESLVYWQARGFDPDRPKYLNAVDTDRRRLVANWHGNTGCLVLTEDWLSGYRVHRATGFNVYALLGTHLTDEIAAQIVEQKSPVAVWLDPDSAGQTAARKISRKLTSFGVENRKILTDKDPKLYSDREIREVLNVT